MSCLDSCSGLFPAQPPGGEDGVVPGVALRIEEAPAAGSMEPALVHASRGVAAQVEVGPPLGAGGGAGVRPVDDLTQGVELGDVAGSAPRTLQDDHLGNLRWGTGSGQ